MKKLFTLLATCLFITMLPHAQNSISAGCDTIVLKNGRLIPAEILQSKTQEVWYVKCGDTTATHRALNSLFIREIRNYQAKATNAANADPSLDTNPFPQGRSDPQPPMSGAIYFSPGIAQGRGGGFLSGAIQFDLKVFSLSQRCTLGLGASLGRTLRPFELLAGGVIFKAGPLLFLGKPNRGTLFEIQYLSLSEKEDYSGGKRIKLKGIALGVGGFVGFRSGFYFHPKAGILYSQVKNEYYDGLLAIDFQLGLGFTF